MRVKTESEASPQSPLSDFLVILVNLENNLLSSSVGHVDDVVSVFLLLGFLFVENVLNSLSEVVDTLASEEHHEAVGGDVEDGCEGIRATFLVF